MTDEKFWTKIWRPEYVGVQFQVIIFAVVFGLRPGQTTSELIKEVERLSESDMSELFSPAFKIFRGMRKEES